MRISDWSSDVCSSDLECATPAELQIGGERRLRAEPCLRPHAQCREMHVAVAAMDVECSFATLFGEGFGRRPERGQAGKRLQREPPDIEAIAGFGEKLDDRAVIAGRGDRKSAA